MTLVGKGVCFDTGGLDIKPSAGMLIMKKDMGGAATALALASMIMDAKLPVRLRVVIPIVENAIAGNAFRPGDIYRSRKGLSVEIGNTDAEGRLILADALALADEEAPDLLFDFATLTGAARVALGPDLPPMYSDDDALAAACMEHGRKVHDPVWRMPLWNPYDKHARRKNFRSGECVVGPVRRLDHRGAYFCAASSSARKPGRISTFMPGIRRRCPDVRKAAKCRSRGCCFRCWPIVTQSALISGKLR